MSAVPPVSPVRRTRDPARPGLKGVLALIFWSACGITAAQLAWPFTLIATIGPEATASAVVDALSGPSLQSEILRFGVFPQLALFVWAAAFVIVTVMRLRLALIVAPLLMGLWALVSIVCQFGIRNALSPDGLTADALATLLPSILAQVVGAVAFWAYMRQAPGPAAFFTR